MLFQKVLKLLLVLLFFSVFYLISTDIEGTNLPNFHNYNAYGFLITDDEKQAMELKLKSDEKYKQWSPFLDEHQAITDIQEHFVAREGIPKDLRARIWLKQSTAESRISQEPEMYNDVRKLVPPYGLSCEYSDEIIEQICKDVPRTFSNNVYFRKDVPNGFPGLPHAPRKSLQESLYNILAAFSFRDNSIGYQPGMNYVAAMLLLLYPEEKAFYMLVVIIEELLPTNFYAKDMIGIQTEKKVITEIISERFSEFSKTFKKNDNEIGAEVITWFTKMFVNVLPLECVLRLWDVFFFEGFETLHRASIAIFNMIQQSNAKNPNYKKLSSLIRFFPAKIADADMFMKNVYSWSDTNSYGELTEKNLEKLRSKSLAEIFEERESLKQDTRLNEDDERLIEDDERLNEDDERLNEDDERFNQNLYDVTD